LDFTKAALETKVQCKEFIHEIFQGYMGKGLGKEGKLRVCFF
jgi:hypothetical protein